MISPPTLKNIKDMASLDIPLSHVREREYSFVLTKSYQIYLSGYITA